VSESEAQNGNRAGEIPLRFYTASLERASLADTASPPVSLFARILYPQNSGERREIFLMPQRAFNHARRVDMFPILIGLRGGRNENRSRLGDRYLAHRDRAI